MSDTHAFDSSILSAPTIYDTNSKKLIFISTISGTYDKCRVFSTRDEERRSHFVYTEGFTTQVRVLPR